MTTMLAMTMTGPNGTLAHWQTGPARNRFEPSLSPSGNFTGRKATLRLNMIANRNRIPCSVFETAAPDDGNKVVILRTGLA